MKQLFSELEAFVRDRFSVSEQLTSSAQTKMTGVSRRQFLSGGSLLAVSSIATFGVPEMVWAQGTKRLDPCWSNELIDATWTRYGHLRTVVIENQGRLIALPLNLSSPDQLSMIDFVAGMPIIHLGKTPNEIIITPRGVRMRKGDFERSWSKDVTKMLIETIMKSNELQRAALSLRLAWHATYPEYLYRRKAVAPDKIAKQFMKYNATITQFAKKGKSADLCRIETVTETVTTILRREENIILTAVEQFSKCLSNCKNTFGDDVLIGDKLLCEANCFGMAFVDLVVGTTEIVETIAETVVSQTLICPTKLPKGKFPNPFTGLMNLPGTSGAVAIPQFSDDVIEKARSVLIKLMNEMPPVVKCLIAADWKITNIGDLGLSIPGVASVPFGVTVCLDRQCTQTILSAGGFDAIDTITALVDLGGLVTVALAAGAALEASMLLIGLIAVLLAHLVIVAGQIAIYEALGMIPSGVCITHPSLPVVAAGVVNPLLGILAVGNTPLVVTPA